jgi:carbamate kinase
LNPARPGGDDAAVAAASLPLPDPRDPRRLVVALGGRALREPGAPSAAAGWSRALARVLPPLVDLVEAGFRLVVTGGREPRPDEDHRGGPVGPRPAVSRPLDRCAAAAQGALGYALQQALGNLCRGAGLDVPVVALVTPVVVDAADPAFGRPSVPVGPHYQAAWARRLAREPGWVLAEDGGRGFRRLVPAPRPLRVADESLIRRMAGEAAILVVGGSGVPVVETGAGYRGVEAVLEPDLTAERLAHAVRAARLLLLTDVERVLVSYGTPRAIAIETLDPGEARALLAAGEFPGHSMGAKVDAAIRFVEGGGREAIITTPEQVGAALAGKTGTRIAG